MLDRTDLVRVVAIGGVLVLAVLFLLWKLFGLMVVAPRGQGHEAPARSVERGPILDRNGKILAIETREASVSAWLPDVVDEASVAEKLAPILDVSSADLLATLRSHSGFVYLKRKISQSQSRAIEGLIAGGDLKGIYLQPEYARIYPQGDLAGHVLGYVGTDNVGLDGIEYSFDRQLSPPPNGKQGVQFGDQVFLTIDLNVQFQAQEVARRAFEETKAESVILMVMDARNGDILGYVSMPEFDPNAFSEYPAATRVNRPIQYLYEPGSVLKIFTISSFMQLGGITSTSQFYDNGVYEHRLPNGSRIQIRGLAPEGYETPRLIIKYSSNVGAAYASDTVSDSSFYEMLQAFGFGKPTYLALPGEIAGLLRSPDQWSPRSRPTIAFGQEIGVTAIQVLAAATALTNGGVLLKPHIVHKVVAPDGKPVMSFPREPIRQVISPAVAREMLSYMQTASEEGGTATLARIPGIDTSAKTGTANVFDLRTGKYSETSYVASTIAIFPTSDPRLIVYSLVINPRQGSIYGARAAAPIVRELSERLTTYLEIPTSSDQTIEHSAVLTDEPAAQLQVGSVLPDLRGLSKRQILPLLNARGVHLDIEGNGWIVRQRPAAGTPITEGMTVSVDLE